MCGIAGILNAEPRRPVDADLLRVMTDRLAHRGADGSGQWIGEGIGLGHRRLAIIDLAGSPQPMATDRGDLVISYNGEIYNYREVRAELVRLGHRFRTEGDTEVILLAYRQWGADCLARLNGMFAFAIWNAADRSLFLARDRLGVKPLFFAELADGSVIFASELKALLLHPALPRRPDPRAIDAFLAFGYVPDDRSFLAGVRKLAAGHHLTLKQGRLVPAPVRYWDVDFSRRSPASEAELSDELYALLTDAVRLRTVSDVPVGAFLSGGVDSSAVVALLSDQSRAPVTSCSIGFDDAGLDETRHAEKVARLFGTDHHARTVASDDFDAIDRLAAIFDEPFADASALPTLRVAELAREHVTVALSGDGADEAFAGYRRHVFHHGEERLRALLPAGLRRPVFGALASVYPKADWAPRFLRAKTTLAALGANGNRAYVDAMGVTGAAQRERLYGRTLSAELAGYRAEDAVVELMAGAPARSGLDRAQYADLKTWLPGDILTKVDRTSMAVGLEAREPLLDYRLIEFAAALPEAMRVQRATGKYLLKKTMERRLPDDILYRGKMGFVTPIARWFRGPLAARARGVCQSDALIARGWFDADRLRKVADDHIAGRRDNARLLWQLVMLERSAAALLGD